MSGLMTVFIKELSDHFNSWRSVILFIIVIAVGLFSIYIDAQFIRQTIADSKYVFLMLYTTSGYGLPLFTFFIAFFMPIVGIVLGFDTINSEKNNGTMSRLLSQPIFRDSVINGKFLAGVVTMAIMLVSMVMLVGGVGLRMIGVPPTSEEVFRLIAFLVMAVVYGAFWLGLAMLFSVFFQRVATSALASIALWIFFIFLFIFPLFIEMGLTGFIIMQVSPIMLFWQVITILLVPTARPLGQLIQSAAGMVPTSPLSVGQSLLAIWPSLVTIIALTVVCFAISYIKFMREEIRST